MKKLICISVFISFSIIAGECRAQNISYNVIAGISANSYSVSGTHGDLSPSESDLLRGWNFGMGVYLPVFPALNIKTGLVLAQKGGKTVDRVTFSYDDVLTITEKVRLFYIDIPLLGQYEFSTLGSTIPFIQAGVFTGYHIGGEPTAVIRWEEEGEVTEEVLPFLYFGNEVNRWNYGVIVGGGFRFSRLFFDIRYELGIADVTNKAIETLYTIESNKLSGLTISVGLHFGKSQIQ